MILYYLKKQGGWSLIKRYVINRVFIYALLLFGILPKNRFGLEVLSECIENRIKDNLKKKYGKLCSATRDAPINQYDKEKVVWICWLQGIENAPLLVKKNVEYVKQNLPEYNIKIITEKNFRTFTCIPEYMIEKWKMGIISNTHFSDILRVNLLIHYGGIWIDSTVFVSDKIPKDIEDAPFFLFRSLKPGGIGKAITVSSWFISSCKNYPILVDTERMLYTYWKKKNYLNDYFLFHLFLEIAMENNPDLVDFIPKYTNDSPHILLYELFSPFEQKKFDSILDRSFVHKLSVKFSEENFSKEGTFYKYLYPNS